MNKVVKILLGLLTVFILIVYYIFFYAPKVHFTEEELTWFNVYEVNDTLIFQEVNTQKKDTSIITKKQLYHKEYDWLNDDGVRQNIANVFYKNKRHIGKSEVKLLEIHKDQLNKKSNPILSYISGSFFINDDVKTRVHVVSLQLLDKSFENVVVLRKTRGKYYTKERHGFWPQTLYWDEKYGIIKYETFSGEVWERVNW